MILVASFFILFTCPSFAQSNLGSLFNLPGAPVAGSAEDIADYQAVLNAQNSRTATDCARATLEVKINLDHFFGAPYGNLTADEVSHWTSFISTESIAAGNTIAAAKSKWSRPRPFVSHTDIQPCIKMESSFSYPSGHSALAEFYARILSIALPDRAADFKARALQIAQDRMIGGVHYPTDVRDGVLLGDQIFDDENQNGALVTSILQNR